jgi:hypothetical protein
MHLYARVSAVKFDAEELTKILHVCPVQVPQHKQIRWYHMQILT